VNAKYKQVPDCGGGAYLCIHNRRPLFVLPWLECNNALRTRPYLRALLVLLLSICVESAEQLCASQPALCVCTMGGTIGCVLGHVHRASHLHCEKKDTCSFHQQLNSAHVPRTKTSKTPQHHTESQRSICREFSPYSAAYPTTYVPVGGG
jgi:hypothetical protein